MQYCIRFKKQPSNLKTASIKYSPILKTEWLPINVLPNCIPPDMQHLHNPFNDTRVNGEKDSEKNVFNRNNPFLQNEHDQQGKDLVNTIVWLSRNNLFYYT